MKQIIDGVNVEDCPAMRTFNVFGQDDKPCCYLEMKYCEDVGMCKYKLLKKRKEAKK